MPKNQYQLIESALLYIDQQRSSQPSLQDVADHIGLSEFYFQRLFTEWAGVSPKQFLQFLNREYLKIQLGESTSILQATMDAGISSTSRTHDLFIRSEGMTPAQYRARGKDLLIYYGLHESPFGKYLLATTEQGICHMAFASNDIKEVFQQFEQDWSEARLIESTAHTSPVHERIFGKGENLGALPVLLRGTPFQLKVWEALISIPEGVVCSYEQLATLSGKPTATRASASAIARNRIAFLIPCHRVIRKIGESGQYRWGQSRKRLMLAWEASQRQTKSITVKARPTDA